MNTKKIENPNKENEASAPDSERPSSVQKSNEVWYHCTKCQTTSKDHEVCENCGEYRAKIKPDGNQRSSVQKRLTDRLCEIENKILKSNTQEWERKITWQLIGLISHWAKPDNEKSKEAKEAEWLMKEIEEIVNRKI